MQAVAIACSVLFVIVDFTQAQDDISNTLYTKRYERLDIDTILASPRLVTNYVECLLNKKPCAPEGKALKRILPEALRTKCGRCQPSQKEIALKVITALYFDYPQYYKALREKWDPTGEYNNRFEEYLRDQKFNAIGGGIESEAGEQAQVNAQIEKKNQTKIQKSPTSTTTTTTRPPSSSFFNNNFSNQPLSLRFMSMPDSGPLLLRPLSRILANIPFFG
uniref:CSP5 n=1 Tax=Eupeodes corollae TaxID=290404 RepID=A0A8F9RZI3_9MUSC|nr:CSP5 [Eupeodes corollae]